MRTFLALVSSLTRILARIIFTPILFGWLILWLCLGAMIGMLVATPFIFAIFDAEPGASAWHWVVFGPFMVAGTIAGAFDWMHRSGANLIYGGNGDSHGSARFAGRKELRKLETPDGLLIGRSPRTGRLLRYDGPAHLLTLAPTRAGKGVGTVIPNLLMADRSVIVVDPKGENARIAGTARRAFGQVHVLDPFGVTGMPSSAYNPLDRLTPDSLDLGEDATTLADALVMDPAGQVQEAHWNEEAKAILSGLIMFCVAHEDSNRRNLATVREYLTLPPERLRALLELMQDSDAADGLVARAANRFIGKADREAASVLSNAQRHTHFLDSPRIANVISRSDFHFADLQQKTVSVFLVLPPNRLDAYARWLRLLVSQALQDIARHAEGAERPGAALRALLRPHRRRNPPRGPRPSSCSMNSRLSAAWKPSSGPWG